MRVSRIPILCLWAALVAAMIHVGSPATMVRAAEAKPKKKDTLAKLQPKEVTYEAKLEPAEAKPGEQVKYSVTLKIDEPWHCYGVVKEQPDTGPRGTQFDLFDLGGLVEAEGEWKPTVAAKTKLDSAFDNMTVSYHEGEVTWTRTLEVPAKAKSGKVTVKSQVYFQICDPKSCRPPVYVTVPAASVTVLPTSGLAPHVRAALAGSLLAAATVPPAFATPRPRAGGIGTLLVTSALGGLFALLMPCVWPMIPITVNFFVKQGEANPGSTTRLALAYCLAIVGIFTGIGLAVTALLGASGANQLGTNRWVNLAFGLAFIAMGLSLLGLFELRLPSSIMNASAKNEGKGGVVGVMFMATTLTITSFTCTAPVVGTLLVQTSQGEFFYPALGLMTFSAVLALPFLVLALMPGLLRKMPRSGDWMNAVKVVGGLVEIALAFKFLNTAEIGFAGTSEVWIDARFVLTAWVVTALACGVYLLGLFRTDHDHEAVQVGPIRMVSGVGFLGIALFLAPALFGTPPKGKFFGSIVGLLPNDIGDLADTRRDTVYDVVKAFESSAPSSSTPGGRALVADSGPRGPVKATSKDPKEAVLQEKKFHGVAWGMSYDAALAEAKAKNRLVLIDFTGVFCPNCRTVEQSVMPRPDTVEELKKFVTVSLFTDHLDINSLSVSDREDGGAANLAFEDELTGQTTSPLYTVVTPDGKLLGYKGYESGQNFLRDFLRSILEKHAPAEKVAAAGGM